MFSLVKLRLKEIFSYKLLMLTLIICPIAFGYFSSYALSERTLDFYLAVYDADNSAESAEYIDALTRLESINITVVEDEATGVALTNSRAVEGMLTIKPGFGSDIRESTRDEMLEYTAAPGTNTSEFMREAFSLVLIHMRSEILLLDALSDVSEQAVIDGRLALSEYVGEPVVSVVFHSELPPPTTLLVAPRHGLAAVFMTLAFLVAVFFLPGKGKDFLNIYGNKALILDYIARCAAILITFFSAIVLYFIGCMLIYDSNPSWVEIVALTALTIFCVGLGAVVALLIQDKRSGIYIYIPFLLINLTLGGAVWGRLFSTNQLFRFFLPVAIFLDACTSHRLLETAIMAAIGLMLLFCAMLSRRANFVGERRVLSNGKKI